MKVSKLYTNDMMYTFITWQLAIEKPLNTPNLLLFPFSHVARHKHPDNNFLLLIFVCHLTFLLYEHPNMY